MVVKMVVLVVPPKTPQLLMVRPKTLELLGCPVPMGMGPLMGAASSWP